MAETGKNLYISNMEKTLAHVQNYSLFGESKHLPDVLHCETIADRSVLHDWELAPHRHARLHQVLLVRSGGGRVSVDDATLALTLFRSGVDRRLAGQHPARPCACISF